MNLSNPTHYNCHDGTLVSSYGFYGKSYNMPYTILEYNIHYILYIIHNITCELPITEWIWLGVAACTHIQITLYIIYSTLYSTTYCTLYMVYYSSSMMIIMMCARFDKSTMLTCIQKSKVSKKVVVELQNRNILVFCIRFFSATSEQR